MAAGIYAIFGPPTYNLGSIYSAVPLLIFCSGYVFLPSQSQDRWQEVKNERFAPSTPCRKRMRTVFKDTKQTDENRN